MRILIIDDEPELLAQLEQVLGAQKYDVETAGDGEAALDRLFDGTFDLILLDIMLPKRDGLSVLREIRRAGLTTPVLMLTAKGGTEDKIQGLDLGADDYLAKPFSVAELLARIRALLRRTTASAQPFLEVADVRLDTISREVTRGGELLPLTPKEFSILEFLLYNKNRAVSRFSLAEHVWGEDFDPFTMSNYIDVHIKNLRQKMGDAGARIRTIRGVGYIVKDEGQ
jgi:DNA-binding response OmpR family regulator